MAEKDDSVMVDKDDSVIVNKDDLAMVAFGNPSQGMPLIYISFTVIKSSGI
jgi:hypothetical protein